MDISGFRRTIRACTVPVGQRTFLRCILSMILCIALFFFTMQAVLADDPATPVRSINHRGYNTVAPENTLPAYELSKENGFQIVETDIAFTKDGVPVLLHDAEINRTARNADGSEPDRMIEIRRITYEEALVYDFGIWKGEEYKGTRIPTFEEFLQLCRRLDLDPYIELKGDRGYSTKVVEGLVDLVRKYGLEQRATWISFDKPYLEAVRDCDRDARLGLLILLWLSTDNVEQSIQDVKTLQSGTNEVFLDVYCFCLNMVEGCAALCRDAGIPLEAYFIEQDLEEELKKLDPYVSGATTNRIRYDELLKERDRR